MLRLSSILAVLVFAAVALASSRGFIESLRPHVIPAVSRDRLPALTSLLGEHLDRILPDGSVRILADDHLLARLQAEGIEVISSVDQPRLMMDALLAASTPQNPLLEYHDYNELTTLLRQYAAAYPNITQLFSIGKSVSNRELWVIRITDNPTQKEAEPEVIYFGNMHGDEAVGREMLLNLVILLTESYGRDEALTNLVDTTDIYILASLNPDGFERARRANDNGFDLNRNFPDQWTDPGNDPTGRQPETRALMAFWAEHNFVLGANFHGGAVCVNYPYDGLENSSGCGRQISYSPDHDLYVSLSLTYSKLNEPMYNSREFTDGITNGAEWYCIYGSAQDWSYVYHGTLHVTVELSNTKFPAASALAGFWEDNRDSMIAYLQEVHKGVKGRVVEKSTGLPVKASISVKRLDDNHVATSIGPNTSPSHQDGTYFRVLLPGTYQVKVTPASKALLPKTVTVQVHAGAPTALDFEF